MFKNNIKPLVEKSGFSVYRLAKDIGISPMGMYALMEREDLGSTSIRTLVRLAEVLGVEACELYTRVK